MCVYGMCVCVCLLLTAEASVHVTGKVVRRLPARFATPRHEPKAGCAHPAGALGGPPVVTGYSPFFVCGAATIFLPMICRLVN